VKAKSCLGDVRALKRLISGHLDGNNPNLSLILGVRDEPLEEESLSAVELLRAIRDEVAGLQNLITVRYAEQVGNECTVQ
jgi:hypothetical protein